MKRQPISRKRTPEREQLIIDLIGKGVTKKAASHYAGVAEQTFQYWRKHDESFNARVKAAMEKAKADQYEALHAEEEDQLNLFMERWIAGKLSQRERLEIQESFLAYHKQHNQDVINIAPKDQPEKLIDVKLAHAVTSALLRVPEETLNAVSEGRDAETQVGRLNEKRTGRYRYTSAHPVDAVLKDVIENLEPPKDLVENPAPLEDQIEEVDPRQGLSAFQRQILKMREAEERNKLEDEES